VKSNPFFFECVTITTMVNNKGVHLWLRLCSKPCNKVQLILSAFSMKQAPFKKKKSVMLKPELKKSQLQVF